MEAGPLPPSVLSSHRPLRGLVRSEGGMWLLLPAGRGRVGGLSVLPWLGPLDFSVPD